MSFVWLWTDILVWTLVLVLIGAVRSIRRSEQIRKQWFYILKSPIAMSAAIVLSFYLLFALLDSVHFQYTPSKQGEATEQTVSSANNQGVLSLLDVILQHLRDKTERTYSAPFATHEYSTSLSYDESGAVTQVYRPLKFRRTALDRQSHHFRRRNG